MPESLFLLVGFVLAHAAWSVSDLPRGQLLVPLAIVEKHGERARAQELRAAARAHDGFRQRLRGLVAAERYRSYLVWWRLRYR